MSMFSVVFLVMLLLSPMTSFSIQKIGYEVGPSNEMTTLYLSQTYYGEKQMGQQIQYYALSLQNKSLVPHQPLVISMISTFKTFSIMYVNIVQPDQNLTQHLPSTSYYDLKCQDFEILSCVIMNPPQNSILLMGLIIKDPSLYKIVANIQQIQVISPLQNPSNMHILEFNSSQAIILKLNVNQLIFNTTVDNDTKAQEIILRVQYQSRIQNYYTKFVMRAGVMNAQSNGLQILYIGESLGAYCQVLKLYQPANPQNQFYIIITGQHDLTLTLTVDIPDVQIQSAQVIEYLYDNRLTDTIYQIDQFFYNVSSWSDESTSNMNYGIYLQQLSGLGVITVSACDFMHHYSSQYGQSQYTVIPWSLLTCVDNDIYISFSNITQKLGVRFIIQEYQSSAEVQTMAMLYLGQQKVRIMDNVCIKYAFQSANLQDGDEMYFRYSDNNNFVKSLSLTTCEKQLDSQQSNCNVEELQTNQDYEFIQLYYNYKSSLTYNLNICPNSTLRTPSLQEFYSLLLIPVPRTKKIQLDSETFDVINCNQLFVYSFDLNKIQPLPQSLENLSLNVRVRVINGDLIFYQNCSGTQADSICDNNDDQFKRYSASYKLSNFNRDNLFQNFKFGIEALQQSIFSITTFLEQEFPSPDPPGPTPQPYDQNMLHDGFNNISTAGISQAQQKIFVYRSHIIPYNVTPSFQLSEYFCVQIFSSVEQLNQNKKLCSPDSWLLNKKESLVYDSLYLRLSLLDGNSPDKIPVMVSVNIILPALKLQANSSIMISCFKFCYTQVKVSSFNGSRKVTVTAHGAGYINSTADIFLSKLTFDSPPYVLTATLPQGGVLYLQNSQIQTKVISKEETLYQVDENLQLQFIFPIQKYSIFGQILVDSFGSRIVSNWNLYILNKSQSNTISYSYPQVFDNNVNKTVNQNYSETATPLNFQLLNKRNSNGLIPAKCYLQPSIQCFLTVAIVQKDVNIVNNDKNIIISSNVSSYFVFVNTPQLLQTNFGVVYARPLVLLNKNNKRFLQDDGFIIKQSIVTLQPLSSCGTLQAKIASPQVLLTQQYSDQNYVQIYSTQPCVYSLSINSCELPMLFSQVPRRINVKTGSTVSLLYSVTDFEQQFALYVWKNLSLVQSQQNSQYPPLLLNIYKIVNIYNCTALQQNLIYSQQIFMGQQSIYQTPLLGKQLLIDFQQGEQISNLYLIQIQPYVSQQNEQSYQNTYEVNIILRAVSQSIVLLPNQQFIPSLSTASKQGSLFNQFTHYTHVNNWDLCYLLVSGTDVQGNITIKVFDSQGQLTSNQFKFGHEQKCITILKRSSDAITQYSIVSKIQLADSKQAQKFPIVWFRVKQYIQPIQINHASSIVHANSTIIQSSSRSYLNGVYGKCYNFDLTSLDNSLYVIVYLDHPVNKNASNKPVIHIPGTKLQYNVSQVVNSRTQMIIGYRAKILSNLFEQEGITLCVKSVDGFFITFIQQFDSFMVSLNEEQNYRKVSNNGKYVSLQIYKFLQFENLTKISNNETVQKTQKKYIVTQVFDCLNSSFSNFTMLGSNFLVDVLLGNVAKFEQTFSNYSIQSALSVIDPSQQLGSNLYIGVKSSLDDSNYSIKMYENHNGQLPQMRWTLVGTQFSVIQSQDHKDIIVQLPIVSNVQPNGTLKPTLNYHVYVIDREDMQIYNASKVSIRCPNLEYNSKYSKQNLQIFNMSLTNPKIPLFKINIDSLKSLKNISIMASVTIAQTAESMPFTYYYNSQNLNLPKDGSGGSSINFGLLFVIGGVATFFIILIRVITKIMRRRSDRNDVQFELSDQNNTTRNNNTAATANNTVNSTGNSQLAQLQIASPIVAQNQIGKKAQNSNVGYGQFVDEDQVTV